MYKRQVCRRSVSADETAAVRFKAELFALFEKKGIIWDQIYNCDETGLNYTLIVEDFSIKNEASTTGMYKKNK